VWVAMPGCTIRVGELVGWCCVRAVQPEALSPEGADTGNSRRMCIHRCCETREYAVGYFEAQPKPIHAY